MATDAPVASASAQTALRQQRPWLVVSLVLYGFLALIYLLATPLQTIELPDNLPQKGDSQSLLVGIGPDEKEYLLYILSLAQRGALPAPKPALRRSPDDYVSYQAQHPPLFFAAAAILYRVTAPWLGLTGFWYAIRACCVLCGAGVILLTSRAAALAFPEDPLVILGTPPAIALLPIFGHLCGNLSNEPLAMLFGAAAWLGMVRLAHRPTTEAAPDLREALAVGVCLALAVLTRLTAVVYLPAVLILLFARRQQGGSRLLPIAAAVLGPLCVALGLWLTHNLLAYSALFPRPYERPLLAGISLWQYLADPSQPLAIAGMTHPIVIPPLQIALWYASTAWTPFWLIQFYVPGGAAAGLAWQALALLSFVLLGLMLVFHALRSRTKTSETMGVPSDPSGRLILWMAGATLAATILGLLEQQFFNDWSEMNYAGRYLVAAAPAAIPFFLFAVASRFRERQAQQRALALVFAVALLALDLATALLVRQFYVDHPTQPSVQSLTARARATFSSLVPRAA